MRPTPLTVALAALIYDLDGSSVGGIGTALDELRARTSTASAVLVAVSIAVSESRLKHCVVELVDLIIGVVLDGAGAV